MKKEDHVVEQLNEYVKLRKTSFRQHQRDLSFGEKMQIAFSLAKRDKIIKSAILIPKNKKGR